MERTAVIRAIPLAAHQASQGDSELWVRVKNHLGDDIPLQLLLLRPWRWLNAVNDRPPSRDSASPVATIHYLKGTRTEQ